MTPALRQCGESLDDGALPKLKSLNLDSCNISDRGMEWLVSAFKRGCMANLRELEIPGNSGSISQEDTPGGLAKRKALGLRWQLANELVLTGTGLLLHNDKLSAHRPTFPLP